MSKRKRSSEVPESLAVLVRDESKPAPFGRCPDCGAELLAPFDSGRHPQHPLPNPHRIAWEPEAPEPSEEGDSEFEDSESGYVTGGDDDEQP
jgi:hypothetical protein